MSFFEDEEMYHEEGLCDPDTCRFCLAELEAVVTERDQFAEDSEEEDGDMVEQERLESIEAERESADLGGYRDPAESRSFA